MLTHSITSLLEKDELLKACSLSLVQTCPKNSMFCYIPVKNCCKGHRTPF